MNTKESIERAVSALLNRVEKIRNEAGQHHESIRKIMAKGLEKDLDAIVALELINRDRVLCRHGRPKGEPHWDCDDTCHDSIDEIRKRFYDCNEKLARTLDERDRWRDLADRLGDFLPGGHMPTCECQKCEELKNLRQLRIDMARKSETLPANP